MAQPLGTNRTGWISSAKGPGISEGARSALTPWQPAARGQGAPPAAILGVTRLERLIGPTINMGRSKDDQQHGE